MKTNLPFLSALRRSLLRVALAASAISTSSGPVSAVAQTSGSPVGTWDCIMSGARTGVAYLAFTNYPVTGTNGTTYEIQTFDVYEVLVPKGPPLPPNPSSVDRGPNTDVGRNPESNTGPNTNTPSTSASIFGFLVTSNNPWTFDSQGRVLGFFAEEAAGPCTTNYYTNIITGSNTVSITCSSLTNSISFVGKVVPGKRINLVASTPNGKVTYRGKPAATLPDFSGSYYAIEKQKNPPSYLNEFFTLMSNSAYPPFINAYNFVDGMGPGYSSGGIALISSQRQMGFVSTNTASANIRAVNGSFNLNKARGTLAGWDQSAGPLINHVTLKVVKQ